MRRRSFFEGLAGLGAAALVRPDGLRMPLEDSYIAATARRHGLTIVTGNDRHFRRPGLSVFNPFKEL
jgi:predicted nucleic acid-binding protein